MARVERRCSWDVAGEEADLRKTLLRFFRETGMKVAAEDEGEFHTLHVRQGSQFWTRLLGGWFISAATLPKRAQATFTRTSNGLRLRVTIEESLGIGILDPLLKQKYEAYFEDWLNDLDAALDLVPDGEEPRRRRENRPDPAVPEDGVMRPDDRLAQGDDSSTPERRGRRRPAE